MARQNGQEYDARLAGQSHQGPHVDADQFRRRNADHRRQRAVHAQHFVGLIVHHDEVGDGVEDLDPMAVRLLDAGEQPRILQRHRGMTRHGFQENSIFGPQGEASRKDRAVQPIRRSRRAVAPACNRSTQAWRQPPAQHLFRRAGDDRSGMCGPRSRSTPAAPTRRSRRAAERERPVPELRRMMPSALFAVA